jgi:hypothetical protein
MAWRPAGGDPEKARRFVAHRCIVLLICPICPALRGLIGEISFYAFGFEKGRHLAKKMVLCLVFRMLRMLCGVGW